MPNRKKRKNTKTIRKSKPKKRVRSSELSGIFLILVSLFLLISLISYNSQDPSWASTTSSDVNVNNYGGKAGASTAEVLLQVFGFTSFLIPLVIFILGLQIILPKEDKRLLSRILGILFLLLILSALLFTLFQDVNWRGARMASGGFIGNVLSSFFIHYFNHIGTILILAGLLIFFFIFSAHLSVNKISQFFSKIIQLIFKEVRIRITRYQKAKRKERLARNVIEKYAAPNP